MLQSIATNVSATLLFVALLDILMSKIHTINFDALKLVKTQKTMNRYNVCS